MKYFPALSLKVTLKSGAKQTPAPVCGSRKTTAQIPEDTVQAKSYNLG